MPEAFNRCLSSWLKVSLIFFSFFPPLLLLLLLLLQRLLDNNILHSYEGWGQKKLATFYYDASVCVCVCVINM